MRGTVNAFQVYQLTGDPELKTLEVKRFLMGFYEGRIPASDEGTELLRRKAGSNALIDLSVDGAKATPVLVHGVAWSNSSPVTRTRLATPDGSDSIARGGGTDAETLTATRPNSLP